MMTANNKAKIMAKRPKIILFSISIEFYRTAELSRQTETASLLRVSSSCHISSSGCSLSPSIRLVHRQLVCSKFQLNWKIFYPYLFSLSGGKLKWGSLWCQRNNLRKVKES